MRVTALAVDVDLLEHRERDAVGARAERGDLLRRARLLTTELVAREAEHGEALVAVGALQALEPLVLRGEPALRGHVDDERHLALVVVQVGVAAVECLDVVVVDAHGIPLVVLTCFADSLVRAVREESARSRIPSIRDRVATVCRPRRGSHAEVTDRLIDAAGRRGRCAPRRPRRGGGGRARPRAQARGDRWR